MTIEERKTQLLRIIDDVQSIDGLHSEGLERKHASISNYKDEQDLDVQEQCIAMFIYDTLNEEAARRKLTWHPVSSQAKSSTDTSTLASNLEEDIALFKKLISPKAPSPSTERRQNGKARPPQPKLVSIEEVAAPSPLSVFDDLSKIKAEYARTFLELSKSTVRLYLTEDPEIMALLETFRTKAAGATEVISNTDKIIEDSKYRFDTRQHTITSNIEKANLELMAIYEIFEPLKKRLQQRIEELAPFAHEAASPELIQKLRKENIKVHALLKKSLRQFLNQFMELSFGDKSDTDTQTIVKELTTFIDSLVSNMSKGDLMLDISQLAEFKSSLYHHLNEKSDLREIFSSMIWEDTSQAEPLTAEKIEQMLASLFTTASAQESSVTQEHEPTAKQKFLAKISSSTPQDLQIAQIREQLANARLVTDKIEQFAIQGIKNYSVNLKNLPEFDKRVTEAYNRLHEDTAGLLHTLSRLKVLNFACIDPSDEEEKKQYDKAMLYISTLQNQLQKLEEDNTNYLKESSKLSLIQQPIERLNKIIELQNDQLSKLTAKRGVLGLLDEEISKSGVKSKLGLMYNRRTSELSRQLEREINNCQLALNATTFLNAESTAEISALIADCQNLATTIKMAKIATDTPERDLDALTVIPELQRQYSEAVSTLDARFQTCKEALSANYSAMLASLSAQSGEPFTAINNLKQNNPMIEALTAATEEAEDEMESLTAEMQQLTHLRGEQLAAWKASMDAGIARTETAITERNIVRQQARIIEVRFHNPYYRVSTEIIIPRLRAERNNNRNNHALCSELDQMITEFSRLNSRYINRDLNKIGDGNEEQKGVLYKNLLRGKINNRILRNERNDLEIFSNGINSPFSQWIRTHILKPILDLLGNRNRLFTPGAARPERNMAHLGNNTLQWVDGDQNVLVETLNTMAGRPR
ncbi:hypothetical protein [Legionella sp. CNM-4043-24]|uniref:hypothetical protein n=1 Tax=Legionella sp. CNM-4043-24 TaxID=3421646 RepID=UPI00403AEA36